MNNLIIEKVNSAHTRRRSKSNSKYFKFYYRCVEKGRIPGLTIARNGFMFAYSSGDVVDRLSKRYDLCGAGTVEPALDDHYDAKIVQPEVIEYRFYNK